MILNQGFRKVKGETRHIRCWWKCPKHKAVAVAAGEDIVGWEDFDTKPQIKWEMRNPKKLFPLRVWSEGIFAQGCSGFISAGRKWARFCKKDLAIYRFIRLGPSSKISKRKLLNKCWFFLRLMSSHGVGGQRNIAGFAVQAAGNNNATSTVFAAPAGLQTQFVV